MLRGPLTGVNVFTAHPGDEAGTEAVILHTVRNHQSPQGFGAPHLREETYVVEGVVFIARGGAGETVIKDARDRATALLVEVETQVRDDPKISGTVASAQIGDQVLEQGFNADLGRFAQWRFEIEVQASI